jgi:signal peptidase I
MTIVPDETSTRSPRRRGWSIVRDTLVVAVVAAVVFQALRRTVADRYIVPSDSMQPLLYGSRDAGDVVLVDKLAKARDLRRYDTAVFRSPEDPRSQLVKRVVALGDDFQHSWLELRDGDLWLGGDEQHLERDVKDPLATRDLRLPWFEWPSRNQDPVEQTMLLPAGRGPLGAIVVPSLDSIDEARKQLAKPSRANRMRLNSWLGDRWLASLRAVDAGSIDAEGQRRRDGGSYAVDDVGIDCAVDLQGCRRVFCGLLQRPDLWAFHWEVDTGTVELWRNGETVALHTLPRGLESARRLEFGFLDGRFFLCVDGRADALWCEVRRPDWLPVDKPMPDMLPKNQLILGAIGPSGLHVQRFTVFRDIYWYRERMLGAKQVASAVHLDPGTAYLLGDNSFDSRDSRTIGPVSLTAFIGRPRCVLGPWSRKRWLSR